VDKNWQAKRKLNAQADRLIIESHQAIFAIANIPEGKKYFQS
jgi:hypothetical protein